MPGSYDFAGKCTEKEHPVNKEHFGIDVGDNAQRVPKKEHFGENPSPNLARGGE